MKRQNSKEDKQTGKQQQISSKLKSNSQQVINLQQEITEDSFQNHDKSIESLLTFINQKCSVFFSQSNSDSNILIEQQKLEMMIQAARMYPEFSHEQLERLVQRDWRYMFESERQKRLSQMNEDSTKIQEQLDMLQKEIDNQALPVNE